MRHLAFRLPSSSNLEEMIETAVATDQTAEALADAILADEPHFILHIYYESAGSDAALLEARHSGFPLGGPYSARRDRAHTPVDDLHLHIFARNNEIAAINRDGTGHDGSSGIRLPARAADGIRRLFPEIHVPASNIIESAPAEFQKLINDSIERLLLEEGGA